MTTQDDSPTQRTTAGGRRTVANGGLAPAVADSSPAPAVADEAPVPAATAAGSPVPGRTTDDASPAPAVIDTADDPAPTFGNGVVGVTTGAGTPAPAMTAAAPAVTVGEDSPVLGGTTVLAALAGRYANWLALPPEQTAIEIADAPDEVRAMPVILHIERATPPSRTALLEAAAAAALAVCLDPRADPNGPWHNDLLAWTSAHIRKVARRARGTHWQAITELPGRTIKMADAEVRALVPGLVHQAPKEISRLQITGSELPFDEPSPPPPDTPILWLNPGVPMTAGKAAAQVGHATMLLAALLAADGRNFDLTNWAANDCRNAVRMATPTRWAELHPGNDPLAAWRQHGVVAVRDGGFTEVAPGTITVLAQWSA